MKNTENTAWKAIKDEEGHEYDHKGIKYIVICKYCRHEAYYNTDWGHYERFDYCPFCGKKMRNDT